MKHKWDITPRGKKTKYYTCKTCGEKVIACSRKEADNISPKCDGKKILYYIAPVICKSFKIADAEIKIARTAYAKKTGLFGFAPIFKSEKRAREFYDAPPIVVENNNE